MPSLRIGDILISKKWISQSQLDTALEEQKTSKELIGEILVRKGFLSRHLLFKALSEQFNIEYIDLTHTRINPEAVAAFPASLALQYSVMPVECHEDEIILAVPAPVLTWPESEFLKNSRFRKVKKVLCLPDQVRVALAEHYRTGQK